MANMIESLTNLLEQEKECFEALEVLSKDKQKYLIDKNIDKVAEYTTREESFIGRVVYLDKQIQVLIKDLALVLGMPRHVSLNQVIEGCSEEERKPLNQLMEDIKKLVTDIKKINEVNEVMITYTLQFVEFGLSAIRSQRQSIPTGYSAEGDFPVTESLSYFDTRQ